jgi:cell wall-associated NlpC family hydrolase
MIPAADFVAAARLLVGVPFVHQGHSRHGVDCVGCFIVAAEIAGLDISASLPGAGGRPFGWDYTRDPQPVAYSLLKRWALPMPPPPVPGCLIFFRFPRDQHPSHFAIFTGSTIIHSISTVGRVIESSYGRPWTNWTHSRWAVPGVRY